MSSARPTIAGDHAETPLWCSVHVGRVVLSIQGRGICVSKLMRNSMRADTITDAEESHLVARVTIYKLGHHFYDSTSLHRITGLEVEEVNEI